jgi:predicted branched-subunit amino acid permease
MTTRLRSDRRTAELRNAALRDVATVTPGVAPFGVMLGVAAVSMGTGGLAAILGSVTVYGGSAQLTTLTVLHLGSGLVAAVLSGAVVNARVMLYGAALQPRFLGQPLWFRILAPQFILDQTYLSAIERGGLSAQQFRRYWAWLGGSLLAVWTTSVMAGVLVGPLLPDLPHLGMVPMALFLAMLAPRVTDRTAVTAALTAAAATLGVVHLVPALGIIAGTIAGVGAAVLADREGAS